MTDLPGRIIGLYRRHARLYAEQRAGEPHRALMEAGWLDRFLALMPDAPAVLDLGCGCGAPLARALLERGCQISGIDSAPELIAVCEARLPAADWPAQWLVRDMRGLALNRTFDGILAWDSVFHLSHDDQRSMFAVFGAHAAPGTALMFTSGPAHGEAIGSFAGEALYHASLDPAEYRALLAQNGFAVIAHAVEDESCGRHTIWLARRSRNSASRG